MNRNQKTWYKWLYIYVFYEIGMILLGAFIYYDKKA